MYHDSQAVGHRRAGLETRALVELPRADAGAILVAAFDAGRLVERIAPFAPDGAKILTLDEVRLPPSMLSAPRYLDRLNFATNFAFFRDRNELSTRLVSANYWAGYGARAMRLWLRLFDADGAVLATWEQEMPAGPGGFAIDSRAVRARFDLPEFTGQLFLHAIGATGHDVVKYALDTFATDGLSLSCTHDANAWPSDRYAGLPAPGDGERVILWVQNSHATPIPPARSRSIGWAPRPRCRSIARSGRLPPWRSTPAPCCPACAGRRRSSCAPVGMWCGRGTRSCGRGAHGSRM